MSQRACRSDSAHASAEPDAAIKAEDLDYNQLFVPEQMPLQFGQGFDRTISDRSSRAEPCMQGTLTKGKIQIDTETYDLQIIDSQQSLASSLNASAKLSLSYGLGKASAQADYMSAQSSSTNSVYMVVNMEKLGKFNCSLGSTTFAYDRSHSDFRRQCGDSFLQGARVGAKLVGVLRIDTDSSEQQHSLAMKLKAKYNGGLVSLKGSAEMKTETTAISSQFSVSFKAFVVNLGGMEPATTVDEFLKQIDSFDDKFNSNCGSATCDDFACAYQFTLSDYPDMPSDPDLNHILDVLGRWGQQWSAMAKGAQEAASAQKDSTSLVRVDPSETQQTLDAKYAQANNAINLAKQILLDCSKDPVACKANFKPQWEITDSTTSYTYADQPLPNPGTLEPVKFQALSAHSCAEYRALFIKTFGADSGIRDNHTYLLNVIDPSHPAGVMTPIFCTGMRTDTPKDYLTLTANNYAMAGGTDSAHACTDPGYFIGSNLTTTFARVRLLFQKDGTIQVDTTDTTFGRMSADLPTLCAYYHVQGSTHPCAGLGAAAPEASYLGVFTTLPASACSICVGGGCAQKVHYASTGECRLVTTARSPASALVDLSGTDFQISDATSFAVAAWGRVGGYVVSGGQYADASDQVQNCPADGSQPAGSKSPASCSRQPGQYRFIQSPWGLCASITPAADPGLQLTLTDN